jgi:hypothetical protein
MKPNQPRPGEIALKTFVQDQMEKTGLSKGGILKRVHAGFYRHIKLRTVNQRVVFCRITQPCAA